MAEPEEELQGEDGGSAKKVQKRSRRKEKRREEEPQVLEEENQSDCVLLRGIFKLGKKSHDVLLTRTRLTWTPIVPETPTGEPCTLQPGVVLLQDVFAVKVKRRRAVGQQTGGAFLGLALFYCRRRGRKLEEDTLHLHNSSSEHTHRWYSTLKEQLQAFSSRPRYLKVFINPCSHKKEAVYIYREHVAPLFKVADVRTDITVTERRGHALSVMKECKLDEYDGVVCVGGDGSVAEVCHAMVLRAQLDADSPEKPVKPALPLGIIPAGSTDVVSCSVHGVRDPPTAAMHIVLGHLQQLDMCSFSSFGQLMRFGFSAMFGFGAQSLARAEKKRWMPSSQRREYALVKTLARLRPEDCQISFLPSNRTNRNLSEQQDQQQDQQQDPESVVAVGEESWATIQGLYLSISVMSIPCLSPVIPRGLAPNTRLANGSASLIAVGNASRSEFVKHLKRYSSSSGQVVYTMTHILLASILMKARQLSVKLQGVMVEWPVFSAFTPWQFSFSFVETHDISAVKIQLQAVAGWPEESEEEESKTSPIIQSEGATCLWNIDGELVEMANEVLIRVHPCLVTLYGEEVDEAESAVSCSCI